jgi:hypothetical protein
VAVTARIKAVGGWIDATFADEAVTMAAVGPPLAFLAKEPLNTAQKQKRTEERGRYRRMALDALRTAGAGNDIDDAAFEWTYRAG